METGKHRSSVGGEGGNWRNWI